MASFRADISVADELAFGAGLPLDYDNLVTCRLGARGEVPHIRDPRDVDGRGPDAFLAEEGDRVARTVLGHTTIVPSCSRRFTIARMEPSGGLMRAAVITRAWSMADAVASIASAAAASARTTMVRAGCNASATTPMGAYNSNSAYSSSRDCRV